MLIYQRVKTNTVEFAMFETPKKSPGVTHAKRVNPLGRWFGRMAFTTGQPRFEPAGRR